MKVVNGRYVAVIAALLVSMSVGVSKGSPVELWDGLITYWAMNEGSGTTLGDSAPSGAVVDNGVVRDAPAWITSGGPFNTGLQFTGAQSVYVPNSADKDIGTNAVTLSAWVKLDVLPADSPTDFMGIYDSTTDDYVLYLDRGNNELRFKATRTGNVTTVAQQHPGIRAGQLDTSSWMHVMGVYDGDRGTVKIYHNGQLADVTTHTNSANMMIGAVRAGQVAGIGAEVSAAENNPAARFFQGGMTDVAIWNRPLGLAEAEYLYNSGSGNAVGSANPAIAPVVPLALAPSVDPVIHYAFEGNLDNSGSGGPALNAVRQGTPANASIFTPTAQGQGLDLRQNPIQSNAGDWLAVNYTLPEQGTIATMFTADKHFNHQAIWDNAVNGNNWEMWVYGDGRAAARVLNGTPIVAYNLNLGDEFGQNHLAFTWERQGAQVLVRLYVNGEWVDERIGNWTDPGSTFFIGGGHTGNNIGSGIWDEFRIYDVALSESEILYLSQVPEPSSMILVMCGVAVAAGSALRRWRVVQNR